jgi:hypothetical protein
LEIVNARQQQSTTLLKLRKADATAAEDFAICWAA